ADDRIPEQADAGGQQVADAEALAAEGLAQHQRGRQARAHADKAAERSERRQDGAANDEAPDSIDEARSLADLRSHEETRDRNGAADDDDGDIAYADRRRLRHRLVGISRALGTGVAVRGSGRGILHGSAYFAGDLGNRVSGG